jgi:hypothetical protein
MTWQPPHLDFHHKLDRKLDWSGPLIASYPSEDNNETLYYRAELIRLNLNPNTRFKHAVLLHIGQQEAQIVSVDDFGHHDYGGTVYSFSSLLHFAMSTVAADPSAQVIDTALARKSLTSVLHSLLTHRSLPYGESNAKVSTEPSPTQPNQ